MTHNNSGILKKIEIFLLVMVLVGCVSPNKTAPPLVGESGITQTLSPTLEISNTATLVKILTPALMASSISGEVVYSDIDPNTNTEQIFLKNLDTGYVTQLTSLGDNSYPVWSPDGSKIMYVTWTDEKKYSIYIMNKDGSGNIPIIDTLANEREADWSPDGNEIVFVSDNDGNDEIYKMNLDNHMIDRLTFTLYAEAFPHWSPDGNNISFSSSRDSGSMHIFVMDTNGTTLRQVTNSHANDTDSDPIWCPDSTCIVFSRLTPSKLLAFDLNTAKITPLLGNIFKPPDETMIIMEGFPSRSPVRGYITFAVFGKFKDAMFYAIDMKTQNIFPLNVKALSLSLYP